MAPLSPAQALRLLTKALDQDGALSLTRRADTVSMVCQLERIPSHHVVLSVTVMNHVVNHIGVNIVDGVYLWKIQVFMAQSIQEPEHVWLVMMKAMRALTRYAAAGIEETGLGLSDFGILEALLHKGPLPVNTIGPIVDLTPGSISIAVDRLFAKGLVSRVESGEDRRSVSLRSHRAARISLLQPSQPRSGA